MKTAYTLTAGDIAWVRIANYGKFGPLSPPIKITVHQDLGVKLVLAGTALRRTQEVVDRSDITVVDPTGEAKAARLGRRKPTADSGMSTLGESLPAGLVPA